MNKKQKNRIIVMAIIAVIVVLGGISYFQKNRPGDYDDFARCIDESGTKFYGAFWCPHCDDQKELFGNSQRLLPYIECSTADGQGQTVDCQRAQITAYPTWQWPDGTKETGNQTFEYISEKTSCPVSPSS